MNHRHQSAAGADKKKEEGQNVFSIFSLAFFRGAQLPVGGTTPLIRGCPSSPPRPSLNALILNICMGWHCSPSSGDVGVPAFH